MNRFLKRCREATTTDEKAKRYIDILMSSVEYDTFVKLMRLMRPVAQMKASMDALENSESDTKASSTTNAEGKGSTSGGGGKASKDDTGSSPSRDKDERHIAEGKYNGDEYDDVDTKGEKISSK